MKAFLEDKRCSQNKRCQIRYGPRILVCDAKCYLDEGSRWILASWKCYKRMLKAGLPMRYTPYDKTEPGAGGPEGTEIFRPIGYVEVDLYVYDDDGTNEASGRNMTVHIAKGRLFSRNDLIVGSPFIDIAYEPRPFIPTVIRNSEHNARRIRDDVSQATEKPSFSSTTTESAGLVTSRRSRIANFLWPRRPVAHVLPLIKMQTGISSSKSSIPMSTNNFSSHCC